MPIYTNLLRAITDMQCSLALSSTYNTVIDSVRMDDRRSVIDPKLLPPGFSVAEDDPNIVNVDKSAYSRAARIAVGNLACLFKDILAAPGMTASVLWNKDALQKNYKVLCQGSIPQIIDEQTYKIGLALKILLESVENDKDTLDLIDFVLGKLSTDDFDKLRSLGVYNRRTAIDFAKVQLQKRLDIFDAYKPEVWDALPYVVILRHSIGAFKDKYPLPLAQRPVPEFVAIDIQSLEAVNAYIKSTEAYLAGSDGPTKDFANLLADWIAKHGKTFPKGDIPYYFEMPTDTEEEQQKASALFYAIYNNQDLPELTQYSNPYNDGMGYHAETTQERDALTTILKKMKIRHDAIIAGIEYEEALAMVLATDAVLPLPLTQAEANKLHCEIQECQTVIDKLSSQINILNQQYAELQGQRDAFNLLPTIESIEEKVVQAFTEMRERALQALDYRISQRNTQLLQAKLCLKQQEENLLKLSTEGQVRLLREEAETVTRIAGAVEQLQGNLTAQEDSLAQMERAISPKFAALLSEAAIRAATLDTALAHLQKYERLYNPKDLNSIEAVNKEHLQTHLIYLDHADTKDIDSIYTKSFWVSPSSYRSVSDIYTLQRILFSNRQKIEAELAVKLDEPPETSTVPPKKYNLFGIKAKYQETMRPIWEKEAEIDLAKVQLLQAKTEYQMAESRKHKFETEFLEKIVAENVALLTRLDESTSLDLRAKTVLFTAITAAEARHTAVIEPMLSSSCPGIEEKFQQIDRQQQSLSQARSSFNESIELKTAALQKIAAENIALVAMINASTKLELDTKIAFIDEITTYIKSRPSAIALLGDSPCQEIQNQVKAISKQERELTQRISIFNKSIKREDLQTRHSRILDEYLAERNATYYFRDLFSYYASLVFKYIPLKATRETYVSKLKDKLQDYACDPDNAADLEACIEEGLNVKNFSPRGKDSPYSLHVKLSMLRDNLRQQKEEIPNDAEDSVVGVGLH